MFIYQVSIDYKNFTFADLMSACSFAEMAAQNKEEEYAIKITIINQPSQGESNAPHILDETEN